MSESAGQRGCTVGIAGFGTVGQAVARILSTDTHPGLRLTHVCNRNIARKKADWVAPDVVWTESFDDLVDSPVDVVVELIGGLSPAREWIERALMAGKSVVTANKQVIAHAGAQLMTQAGQQKRHLLFEAAVAGGIPIVRALRDGVCGDRLYRIQGVLNGTCNYILTQMEHEQVSFTEALGDAQRLGYAEADPTADVDGLDAQAKLAILIAVGLGRTVRVEDIPLGSISPIAAVDHLYAKRLGCVIRQVARAELIGETGGIRAAVHPALVRRRRRWDGSVAPRTSWSSMANSVARPRSPGSGLEESPPRWRLSRTCWGSRVACRWRSTPRCNGPVNRRV